MASNSRNSHRRESKLPPEEQMWLRARQRLLEIHGPLEGIVHTTPAREAESLRRRGAALARERDKALEQEAWIRADEKLGVAVNSRVLQREEGKGGCRNCAQAYTCSVRVRFGLVFLLCAALVFCVEVTFVLTILFSIILDDSTQDKDWGLRVGLLLPFAPAILIVGSLVVETLLELAGDAFGYFPMRNYRVKLGAVLSWLLPPPRVENADIIAPGRPQFTASHAALVDIIMPGLMEIVGVVSVLVSLSIHGFHVGLVFADYLSNTVIIGCALGAIFPVFESLCFYHPRVSRAYATLSEDSPAVAQELLHVKPLSGEGSAAEIMASGGIHDDHAPARVLNLCRHLMPAGCCTRLTSPLGPEEQGWHPCWSKWPCARMWAWYADIDWHVRVALDFALLALFAGLSVVKSVPTGVRFFMLVLCICVMGFKLHERFPAVFGGLYAAILGFFVVATFFYFVIAVTPPSFENHSVDITRPAFNDSSRVPSSAGDAAVGVYPVCALTWKGITSLDMGLLSSLAYVAAPSLESQLHVAFGGTTLSNFTVIKGEDDDKTIHFYHVRFHNVNNVSGADTDVVAIRGTSTDAEAFADTYLYSSISLLQAVSVWLPLIQVFPTRFLQHLVAFLALQSLAAPQPYEHVNQYVSSLRSLGLDPVITGHSLGGAVGAITSASNGASGLFFNAPGIRYSAQRFGVDLDDVGHHASFVAPIRDPAGLVDEPYGSVHHIECGEASVRCHQLDTTLCALHRACGDDRARGWVGICPGGANGGGPGDTRPELVIAWVMLGVATTVALFITVRFKIGQRLCCCFRSLPDPPRLSGGAPRVQRLRSVGDNNADSKRDSHP